MRAAARSSARAVRHRLMLMGCISGADALAVRLEQLEALLDSQIIQHNQVSGFFLSSFLFVIL